MRIRQIMTSLMIAAVLPACMLISGATAGEALTATADVTCRAAYFSAGIPYEENGQAIYAAKAPVQNVGEAEAYIPPTESAEAPVQTTVPNEETVPELPAVVDKARVISQNITPFSDGLDYEAAGNMSGMIARKHYGTGDGSEYITLSSGAQVRNCTYDSNDSLVEAAQLLPELDIELYSDEPQVLIIHTHTTESYEPYTRAYYDVDFPSRTRDPQHNMTAVGAQLAQTLADNGISVLHDGTVHDYPSYTGSYDRSEETIRAILEEYPSIKIVLDIHRDAIADDDGTRVAPVAFIDGKSAAQFMIIAGCDDGRFNMPDYIENFKLAALIQNMSQAMHEGLARPVLFDYRNYNQHITTGSLLIEIGGHANSLDEALYTAELLGQSIAAALTILA